MKFFALLALLPAALAFPSPQPQPQPEAYNPFLAPPQIASTASSHSNNPISHGALNSRNALSSAHSNAQAAMVMEGKKAHLKRTVKTRKVKRQSAGSCVPRNESTTTTTGNATATGTGTKVVPSPSMSATKTSASTGAATVRPTTSPSPKPSSTTRTTTSSAAAPAKTNFTVDPDGNGPFKGQATCESWLLRFVLLSCTVTYILIPIDYDTDVGYGSCGVWHKNWQPTVALSRELMDNWPGYNGLNPNNNPICGQRLQLNCEPFLHPPSA